MIIINNDNVLGSRSFVEDLFEAIEPVILKEVSAFGKECLEDFRADVQFHGVLHIDYLAVEQFNLLHLIIDESQIDEQWIDLKRLILEAMQEDKRMNILA